MPITKEAQLVKEVAMAMCAARVAEVDSLYPIENREKYVATHWTQHISEAKAAIPLIERALLEEMRDVPLKFCSEAYGLSDFTLPGAIARSPEGRAKEMLGAWLHILKSVAKEKRNLDL